MTEEVRLKGFQRRAPLSDVLAWIEAEVSPLGSERVTFRDAIGRVLAEDVIATRNVPSFPRAAMDGYAVRAADVPGTLALRGELVAAAQPTRGLGEGETVRVMTGARIPAGADAVVMVEHATAKTAAGEPVDGAEADVDAVAQVSTERSASSGQHILRIGEDVDKGSTVLTAGRWLRPQDVAMLVQAGALEVTVRRRPRVVIAPTGTELVATGRPTEGSQVVESNAFMLAELARRDGADPILHPIIRDDLATLEAAMVSSRADVLLLTGGSSVGREDLTPVVARRTGDVAFHGIALKPASSTGLARIGDTHVVLGPGYPVAAYAAWDLVVRPLVLKLLGTADRWPYATTRGVMVDPYPKKVGRSEFVRVVMARAENDDRPAQVRVLPGGSAILSTLTRGDGFLLLPDEQGPLRSGDAVDVHLFA